MPSRCTCMSISIAAYILKKKKEKTATKMVSIRKVLYKNILIYRFKRIME